MTLSNLGFEDDDVGTPGVGIPDAWTVSATLTAELVAEWGAGTPPLDEDGFEQEWNNDSYLFAFDVLDTSPTLLDTDVSEGEAVEDFEEGWSTNHGYSFTLGSAESAMFDTAPEDHEDFEEGWDANEAYDFTLGASTLAVFDSALVPEDFEDFEDGWSGTGAGNDYLLTLTSSTAALFDGAAAPEAFEDFEETRTELQLSADTALDLLTAAAVHGFGVGDRCSFRLVGNGALPAGLNPSFTYYVLAAGLTVTDFKVATSAGGTAIDLVDAGVGTFVVVHDRTRYWVIPFA